VHKHQRADFVVRDAIDGRMSSEQRARLDGLVQVDPELRTRTRPSWLREAPEIPSAKSLCKVLERLAYVGSLDLPTPDRRLHPNRLRQLAARGAP
jgi:hypothetical protein